jgi:hypothetical protein
VSRIGRSGQVARLHDYATSGRQGHARDEQKGVETRRRSRSSMSSACVSSRRARGFARPVAHLVDFALPEGRRDVAFRHPISSTTIPTCREVQRKGSVQGDHRHRGLQRGSPRSSRRELGLDRAVASCRSAAPAMRRKGRAHKVAEVDVGGPLKAARQELRVLRLRQVWRHVEGRSPGRPSWATEVYRRLVVKHDYRAFAAWSSPKPSAYETPKAAIEVRSRSASDPRRRRQNRTASKGSCDRPGSAASC